jgi:hypothetical protein
MMSKPPARVRLVGVRRLSAPEEGVGGRVAVHKQPVVLEVRDKRLGVGTTQEVDEPDHVGVERVADVDDVDSLLTRCHRHVTAVRAGRGGRRVPRPDHQVVPDDDVALVALGIRGAGAVGPVDDLNWVRGRGDVDEPEPAYVPWTAMSPWKARSELKTPAPGTVLSRGISRAENPSGCMFLV